MDNLQLSQGGAFAFASGALANGTTAGTIQTTVIVPYTIDGVFYSKAITNNIAIPISQLPVYGQPIDGSFTGQVGGSVRLYGIYLDTTGAVSLVPGRITNVANLAAGLDTLQFPANIKGKVCIGVMRVALTAGTTFIPNTTALNAAGVTTTYLNLSAIPAEPLKV